MGGRLPDNAWRVDWFLAIPRNANKDAGIGTARAAMPGVAANARPRAVARACRDFEAASGSAEKSLCHQSVSSGRPPPRLLLLLGGALHKSQRGR